MAPGHTELAALGTAYLDRQPWFQAAIAHRLPAPVRLAAADVLLEGRPGLARLLFDRGAQRFQLLVGWRAATEVAGALAGRESALMGSAGDGEEQVLVYDALADDALALEVLALATTGAQRAERVRHVSSLVSHAALVYDDRLFMKCYRVLEEGARPEVDALLRLDAVGFNAILAPVACWRAHGADLALVREFLPSALEGRPLALTSLRDLLAHASEVEEANEGERFVASGDADAAAAQTGGDFSSEMRRLGQTTGRLHLALATAFGDDEAVPGALAALVAGAARDAPDPLVRTADEIAALAPGTAGRSIRLHGDYHLRRVMRTETGWIVAGFSDDPLHATRDPYPSLAPRVGSPVEDLADMCFSLQRVAHEAVGQRPDAEAGLAVALAAAWARRNRAAFLEGYATTPGASRLLPEDPGTRALLLGAFEAVRERRYEATSSEE